MEQENKGSGGREGGGDGGWIWLYGVNREYVSIRECIDLARPGQERWTQARMQQPRQAMAGYSRSTRPYRRARLDSPYRR